MAGCTSCGNKCSGVCASKVAELAGIVGPLGDEALKTLLLGADGDVNRAVNHFFDSGTAASIPLPPPSLEEQLQQQEDEYQEQEEEEEEEEQATQNLDLTKDSDDEDDDDDDGFKDYQYEDSDTERIIRELEQEALNNPLNSIYNNNSNNNKKKPTPPSSSPSKPAPPRSTGGKAPRRITPPPPPKSMGKAPRRITPTTPPPPPPRSMGGKAPRHPSPSTGGKAPRRPSPPRAMGGKAPRQPPSAGGKAPIRMVFPTPTPIRASTAPVTSAATPMEVDYDDDEDDDGDGINFEDAFNYAMQHRPKPSHSASNVLEIGDDSDDSSPGTTYGGYYDDTDDSDDDDVMGMFSNVPLSAFLSRRVRGGIRNRYFSDSDDSDSWASIRRNHSRDPPSPVEVVVPKTYAGIIEIQIEKRKSTKLYDFLKKMQALKPEEYDYGLWGEPGSKEEYSKKVEAFEKGKLLNNITLFKLNRHIAQVYMEEVQDEVRFGELVSFLCKYTTKKRISVDTECEITATQAQLSFTVHFLSSFFNAKRNSTFAKTLFNLLGHDVAAKPQMPLSISDTKPVNEFMGAYALNTKELYEFMESDGYPVSVTPAMLSDLRVELREYQKQVVSWMMDRENIDMGMCDVFWEKRSLPNGNSYYFCPMTSKITTRQPTRVKGGILCEEMGLGKTVEIIALLLANSQHKRHNFFQPKISNGTNTSTTSTSTSTTTSTSTSTTNTTTPANQGDDTEEQKPTATKKSTRTPKRKRKEEIESPPSTPNYSDHTSNPSTPNPSSPPTLASSSASITSTTSTTTTSSPPNDAQESNKTRRSSRAKGKKSYANGGGSDEDFVQESDEEESFKEKKKRGAPRKKRRVKETEDVVEDKERDKEIAQEIQQELQRQAEREKQKKREKEEKEAKEKEAKAKEEKVEGAITENPFVMKNGKPQVRPYPAEDLIYSKATLIVCPVSLLRQWKTELATKVKPGTLRVLQYHGPSRDRDPVKLAKSYDVVLTSYTILTHDRSSQKWTEGAEWGPLEKIHWHRIVMDEAHYLKSSTSLTSKLSRILVGSIKWAVTGTPIQNSVTDIIGILDFLNLEPFRTKTCFNNLEPHQLLDILRTIVMRHSKEQQLEGKPLVDLPPRQERVVYSEMTPDERKLYNHLYSISDVKFHQLANQNAVASHYTYVMSSLIVPLRQMCAHVSLVNRERFIDDTGGSAKRQREGPQAPLLTEDVDLKPALEKLKKKGDRSEITAILSKNGHPECPICLEVSDLPTVTPCLHLFCNGCIREIAQQGRGTCPLCRLPFGEGELVDIFPQNTEENGDASANLDPETAELIAKLSQTHSSKTMKLLEELKAIRAQDKTAKAVVFTQWTPYFKKIEELLHKEGIKFAKLTGDMSMTQKGNSLTKFQSDPSITVFLLSLRSGAVGLTLTAANHLFLLDPSFNKGTEMQAINRIYRIGQTRETTITHLVAKGTIEEKIYKRNLTIHTVPDRDNFTTTTSANQGQKEKASITELMTLFA